MATFEFKCVQFTFCAQGTRFLKSIEYTAFRTKKELPEVIKLIIIPETKVKKKQGNNKVVDANHIQKQPPKVFCRKKFS